MTETIKKLVEMLRKHARCSNTGVTHGMLMIDAADELDAGIKIRKALSGRITLLETELAALTPPEDD